MVLRYQRCRIRDTDRNYKDLLVNIDACAASSYDLIFRSFDYLAPELLVKLLYSIGTIQL